MITLPPVIGGVGSITSDEQWLLNTYPNLSAPAINFQNRGYRTLHYTPTPEQTIDYFRDDHYIIATRPGGKTADIRIDLDFGGRYWNLEAIARLREDLENAGLPGSVLCRSSGSNGRWLVVPLPEWMPSWLAALTMYSLLTDKGSVIKDGDLEISPNVKRWVNRGKEAPKGMKSDWIIDHNAFRLPGQKGFEILDSDGNTIGLGLKDYRHHWEWAKSQQCPDEWQETIDYYSKKENRPKPAFRSGRGSGIEAIAQEHAEFLASGFPHLHQTNDIGQHLARRIRILYPGDIQQQAELVKQAFISMPGYREYCRHQHEIERRCRELARWADKKWSYYGDRLQKPTEEPKPNQNEVRHKNTVDRLTRTLNDWLTNGFTFSSKNQLFEALKRHCRLGKRTFFKYLKELPKFASLIRQLLSAETPTEQALEEIDSNQFTPCSTKRMNYFIEPEAIPPAPPPNLEKEYLIPQTRSPSSSAPYQLSNTPINPIPPTQQHPRNQELSRLLEDFAELIEQSTARQNQQTDHNQSESEPVAIAPKLPWDILEAVQDAIMALTTGDKNLMRSLCDRLQNASIIHQAISQLEDLGATGLNETFISQWMFAR